MWRKIGCSRLMPLPPRMLRMLRATSSAIDTLARLPRLTCGRPQSAGVLEPAELVGQQLRPG